MNKKLKCIKVDERDLFEAAGARLCGWGERDYEVNAQGEYTFLEQRNAYALWLSARGLMPRSGLAAVRSRLARAEFWSLLRKYAMSPEGPARQESEKAVLDHIERQLTRRAV